MNWSIDGIEWSYPCTVERTAEITASEISGLMLDKSYFNDVLGTYLKYDLRIEVPYKFEEQYTLLYETITEPTGQHDFVLPYGGDTITIQGRIENIKDVYQRTRQKDGNNWKEVTHWKGIVFSVISNAPSKIADFNEEVRVRGIPPLPESNVNIGDVYIYESGGWATLADAEDYEY